MLKLLGAVMILTGCGGIGLWYKEQFSGRIRTLRTLERILELLAGEIGYGRGTLPESCRNISGRVKEPYQELLVRIGERMEHNDGDTFEMVFRQEFAPILRESPLKREDRETFFRCLTEEGFPDREMQKRTLKRSQEELSGIARQLEKENAQKGKLAIGLGAMGGIVIVLMLC